jgi:hypothetical protein
MGRAETLARSAVTERYAVDWPLPLQVSELFYDFESNEGNLEPIWRMTFGDTACPLTHRAEVHALTGEVRDTGQSRRTSPVGPYNPEADRSICRR